MLRAWLTELKLRLIFRLAGIEWHGWRCTACLAEGIDPRTHICSPMALKKAKKKTGKKAAAPTAKGKKPRRGR